MSKPMRSFLSTQRSPPSCFSYEDPIECNLQTQSSQTKSRGQFSRKGSVGSPNSHTRKENLPPRRNVKPSPTKEKETSVADNCSRSHGSDGDTESRIQAARVLRRALRSLPQNHQSRYVDSKHKRPALSGICENGGDADSLPIFAASSTSSLEPRTPNHSLHVWEDDPECDVAPASSWSALANKYLLCRPLPLDIGRCACYILHEPDDSSDRPLVYSLYTDEGHGRQDRKLAVARHQRNIGRSEFLIAQNGAGTLHLSCDESFLGRVRSNIIGSRYLIWSEISSSECKYQGPGKLLGVVIFEPTVSTWTGSFRVMRAYVPKYQSIHMSLSNQHEPIGLTKNWQESRRNVHELNSREPSYNRKMRRYELDYRDRYRSTYKIQASSKNFQLTMEDHGKQVILLHGKVSNSKYIMEYSFPLTAYQAFGICLASIDSKLCCSI